MFRDGQFSLSNKFNVEVDIGYQEAYDSTRFQYQNTNKFN